MTIALIGKENSDCATARVGVVTSRGDTELTDQVSNAGASYEVFEDWSGLLEASACQPFDMVFCRESVTAAAPAGFTAPILCVSDGASPSSDALGGMIRLASQLSARTARLEELEAIVDGLRSGSAIVGNTPVMRRLQSAVHRAGECDATVLIEGPQGAGKSLAARVIHLKSRRSSETIVVKECATIAADELTSLLTECAETTLVLEAVDQLPAAAQAVLVKHLKERSSSRAPSMVRLVATTSAHIPELVARGAFREDLFYRLHAFPILVPGLHERLDDVQVIADAILDATVTESGGSHAGFTQAARMLLENMTWSGNVAQLEMTVRRSAALAGGAPIDREHLVAQDVAAPAPTGSTLSAAQGAAPQAADGELTEDCIRPFEEEEKALLGRALRATKGNVRRAAQLLGIGRATLYRKIQQYDLRMH